MKKITNEEMIQKLAKAHMRLPKGMDFDKSGLRKFALAVQKYERDQCATICENVADSTEAIIPDNKQAKAIVENCSRLIRVRGEAKSK